MNIFEALEALKDGKIIKKNNGNTLYKLTNAYYENSGNKYGKIKILYLTLDNEKFWKESIEWEELQNNEFSSGWETLDDYNKRLSHCYDEEEISILKAFSSIGCKWIVRGRDNTFLLYKKEPKRCSFGLSETQKYPVECYYINQSTNKLDSDFTVRCDKDFQHLELFKLLNIDDIIKDYDVYHND